VLRKENCTLEEVLDIQNIANEARSSNIQLVQFLDQEELGKMIKYITEISEDTSNSAATFKFPFACNEIFQAENPSICSSIVESYDLYSGLLNFFTATPPINLTLAAYVSTVMLGLLRNNTLSTA
jgi:serine/threonine-protein phosphatase 6 regulatory subunit 3